MADVILSEPSASSRAWKYVLRAVNQNVLGLEVRKVMMSGAMQRLTFWDQKWSKMKSLKTA